jgi:hypothetical protein
MFHTLDVIPAVNCEVFIPRFGLTSRLSKEANALGAFEVLALIS